jgi:CheY-like chemotaxis protein
LVVDDHPVNRLLVHRVLVQNWPQARVIEAADGLEAVAAVQAHAIDAVFMDMRMPVMDGIDATQAIRRLPSAAAQTLVLGLTANVTPQDLERFKAAGLNDVMLKPFDPVQLCSLIESWVANQGAQGEIP